MAKVLATRPQALEPALTHYCPGCGHGVVHRVVAEVLDELGVREKTIGAAAVGCSVFSYAYFNTDFVMSPHGRAPAVATGIKRARPDRIVFTYQGDGDLASIGTAEAIHAAGRGENITVIMYNNGIYGMTGGQYSPTTLLGAVTATTPLGRDPKLTGYPIRMAELIAGLDGTAYVARTQVADVGGIVKTKRAIKRAFELQIAGAGFTMVEVLGNCPTNWGMNPSEANRYVLEQCVPAFPLGVLKEGEAGGHA